LSLAEISVITGGLLTVLMAIFHTKFYSVFNWKSNFQHISLRNSKIHYTIHLALLLLFFGLGIISLMFARDLATCTGLSLGIMLLLSLFWLWRTIWQIIYFKPLVTGKKASIMHMVLTIHFGLLFITYTLPIVLKFT
jgi:hypothetical protein